MSGLPPSAFPPRFTPGYCSQLCAHHLSCSVQVEGPRWKRTTAFLCAAAKALAWYQGGQTKLDPFLSTGQETRELPA